jgi:hypothetical protein
MRAGVLSPSLGKCPSRAAARQTAGDGPARLSSLDAAQALHLRLPQPRAIEPAAGARGRPQFGSAANQHPYSITSSAIASSVVGMSRRSSHGCGPHGAAVSSLTSCVMTSGRNFEAKPSTLEFLLGDDTFMDR